MAQPFAASSTAMADRYVVASLATLRIPVCCPFRILSFTLLTRRCRFDNGASALLIAFAGSILIDRFISFRFGRGRASPDLSGSEAGASIFVCTADNTVIMKETNTGKVASTTEVRLNSLTIALRIFTERNNNASRS